MSFSRLFRAIVLFVLVASVLSFAGLSYFAHRDRASPYDSNLKGLVLPQFDPMQIDFVPTYDGDASLPFTAGAIVDIDGDGVDEIFLGGGRNQQDAIFQYAGGSFVDITDTTAWSKNLPDKTYSASSLDFDHDGDADVLVTRQSGVYLYSNDNGRFSAEQLPLELDAETVPLSAAVADLNRDGLFDVYISGYIAREFVQGETIFNEAYGGMSALFLNQGNNQFIDVTDSAGLAYHHNTFMGIFIDVDKDQLEDLVVAHDTGQVRTWKNLGDLRFENISNPSSDVYGYPMGIGVTDLGNDGYPDFLFSNVGSTVPTALVRGDLRDDQVLHADWMLFENAGDFRFQDSAEQRQVARFAFSWGALFEDFNLDGRDDLVVSENYEGWPLHKLKLWRLNGRFLLQAADGTFNSAGDEVGVSNREYGITPLVSDFNQDGYPDLVHVNLLGVQNVFMSRGGSQGHLKVKLPNVIESVGARVTVGLSDGRQLVQTFVVGEGLLSDQSHTMIFGLDDTSAVSVTADFLDGRQEQQSGSFRNQVLEF